MKPADIEGKREANDGGGKAAKGETCLTGRAKRNPHPGFASVAAWMASAEYQAIAAAAIAEYAEYQAIAAAAIAKEEARLRAKRQEDARRRNWRKSHGLPTKALPFCLIAFNVPALPALPAKIEAKRYPEDVIYPGQREPFEGREYRPQWMIEAERTVTVSPAGFQLMRAAMLRMTAIDCAAFLRVDVATVKKWEAGDEAIPFAAFWLLRTIATSGNGRDRHSTWDGWHVIEGGPDAGKLCDPRSGHCFTAHEVAMIPRLWGEVSRAKLRADKLADQLAAAEAENIRLRQLIEARRVTAELRAMQERIGALLSAMATAEVVPINPTDRAGKLARVV